MSGTQLPLPGMPPALAAGLLVCCLPGAVAAAHGQPLVRVVSTGPATVRVRLCCDDAVHRVPRGLVRPAPAAVRAVADWTDGGPPPDVALAAETAAGEPAA